MKVKGPAVQSQIGDMKRAPPCKMEEWGAPYLSAPPSRV